MDETATSRRVCIAYPFFPHYRGPVLEELLGRGRHHYTLLADRLTAEPTIKAWDGCSRPGLDWINAPVWRLGKRQGVYIQPGLISAALSRRYDTLVIHSGVWWPTTWLCAILGRLSGKRVLSWGHGWTRRETGPRAFLRSLYYKIYHAHMTYGHLAKAIYLQTGWPAEGVQVIYNSLDYPVQKAHREHTDRAALDSLRREVTGRDSPVVICVTRLIPLRRLDLLIEAAAALKQSGSEVTVLLVGEGPQRETLQRAAASQGVHCVFYGACYDEAVLSRLLMMSAVLVSPGAVGLAAVHAMAYGTPVVTHDNLEEHGPEVEAVIPGKTGGLFTRGDLASLTRQITAWIGTSDTERDRTARDCIQIVERFWNAPMQRRCIERCIDGKPADDLFWMKEAN